MPPNHSPHIREYWSSLSTWRSHAPWAILLATRVAVHIELTAVPGGVCVPAGRGPLHLAADRAVQGLPGITLNISAAS